MRSNRRMVRLRWVVVAGLLVGATAFGPHQGPKISADTVTAMSGAGITKPLRTQPAIRWGAVTGLAGTWQAGWDAATGVPAQIWGTGLAAPGSSTNAAVAEA